MEYEQIIKKSDKQFINFITKNNELINKKNDDGKTLLYLLIRNKMYNKIDFLLEQKANIETIVVDLDFGVVNALDTAKIIDDETIEQMIRKYVKTDNRIYLKMRKGFISKETKDKVKVQLKRGRGRSKRI